MGTRVLRPHDLRKDECVLSRVVSREEQAACCITGLFNEPTFAEGVIAQFS
jgi:hypothetical protein